MKDSSCPNPLGGGSCRPWLPSNKTNLSGAGDFSKETPEGRNLHFGVRERGHGGRIGKWTYMLHGGLRTYVATFFVFSDYRLQWLTRLSALMKLPLTFVFTHDSIGWGETESNSSLSLWSQMAMLRACLISMYSVLATLWRHSRSLV